MAFSPKFFEAQALKLRASKTATASYRQFRWDFQMTMLVFAVAAFLVGMLLGLCFKVFVLLPVIVVSLAAIAGVGFNYECSVGFVLFVMFLGMTALQMGFLCGSVIGMYYADTLQQRRHSGVVETALRLFRQSRT
jgi:hypothetical protein